MANKLFGYMPNGTAVQEYTIRAEGIQATILTYGGTIRTLCVDGRDVVCGYDTLEDYMAADGYLGALIGRYGNRIGGAAFALHGKIYQLVQNDGGKHHLHGGACGFDKQNWTVEEADDDHITLSLLSADGEENYPGNLFVKVTYAIADRALSIAYNAVSDADTFVSLTNHSYFNLGGIDAGDILNTTVQIHADSFTEVDEELIPTGNHIAVEGTPFDFRTPTRVGARLSDTLSGYDHHFIFANAPMGQVCGMDLPHVATFCNHGINMKVYTDRPGAQFYTANFMQGEPNLKGGVKRQKRHAFCFETQTEPDALNHGMPPLKAGELYHTVTVYQFV